MDLLTLYVTWTQVAVTGITHIATFAAVLYLFSCAYIVAGDWTGWF